MNALLVDSYWPATKSAEGIRDLTVSGLLREAAAAAPNEVALVDATPDPSDRRQWTYEELLADVERAARALLARFEPGDRIVIASPSSSEFVILYQAIAMAGMVVVTTNPAQKKHELEYVIGKSGAAGLFYVKSYRGRELQPVVQSILSATPSLRAQISFDEWEDFLVSGDSDEQLPTVNSTDPIMVQYTAGTTGFPKGAILHHKGVVNNAIFVGQRSGMKPGSVCINTMPMYYIGGSCTNMLQTISAFGTMVVMRSFDPALTLELFETYRGTHALMVPTMLQAVLDHPDCQTRDMSSVQTILSGATPVSPALVQRVKQQWGCKFTILFGATELNGSACQTRTSDSPEDQAHTVGQPLPELELKITDMETGEIVPVGVQGEICARGYQVMHGYDQMSDETAATIDEDGWLHMGDLGTMDERGYLRITGRMKDMIIRGGVNLYPREIEEILANHPDFIDLAVLGVPSEKWGEEVAAVVKLRPGAKRPDPENLTVWCRDRLSAHKTPTHWYFAEEYPLTPSGKIQKFALREQITSGHLQGLHG